MKIITRQKQMKQQNTFIPTTPTTTIQVPGMAPRSNAGLPTLFKKYYFLYIFFL